MSGLRLGLIGAGRIGRMHADTIVKRLSGCELVSIADVNQDAARACGEALGIADVHTDASRVLESPSVDAVVICSATDTHARLIEAAADAGKHIFCEKPLALSLAPIDAALARVNAAGVKLQVGFNRRFDPAFAAVKDADVGAMHVVRITSRDPAPPPPSYVQASGGLFLDMMIHDFDMARFLVGAEVSSVFAVGACRVDPAIGQAGDIDTAVVTLTFENGVFATIDNSRRATYGYDQRVECFGAKGMAWADNVPEQAVAVAGANGVQTPRLKDFFIERYAAAYLAEMEAFVRCVVDDDASSVTGEDGRAPVVLALAAARSLAEGRPVRPGEVDSSDVAFQTPPTTH